MRAGQLRHLVTLRRQTDAPDGGTDIDQNFSVGVKHWARIEAVGTAAYWGTKQVGEGVTHRIWFRYGSTTADGQITAEDVIELDDRRYRVMRGGEADDRREYVKVEVKDLGEIV